jgi:choline dehydrogenase-like flavoprotein
VVNTVSRKEEEIRARSFAVCCGSIESARLLLNSRSRQHPNGLANSSDLVGRYLSGHVNSETLGYLDELVGTRPVNTDGATDHSYIPRFNLDGRKRDYVGGFHYQMQYSSFMVPYHAKYVTGFGKAFKNQVRYLQPGFFVIGGWGKVIATPENRVTVDPKHLDAYGIPVPVIHFRFSENDRALFKEMKEKEEEILSNAGVRFMVSPEREPSGFASHETGTVRMGNDPRTSVLNGHNRAHEVKNLFVVDGSCFTTFPEKNPTLTIMAFAVRTARYMASEVRKGNA